MKNNIRAAARVLRTLNAGLLTALSGVLLVTAAHAQEFPAKPIRIIVGPGPDIVARMFGQKFTETWGHQTIVEQRPGGGGTIATEMVAKAPPDGYTLFAGSISTLATNVSMHAKLPYDPIRDFAPVTVTTMSPYVLAINPSVPVTSLKDFVALAKSTGRKFNYASAGTGGGNHLSQELFKTMAGIDLMHVPYKGAAEQTTALIGGEVQMSFIQVQVVLPQVRAGRLKGLGITSAQRLAIAPDLPTIAEAAVPGYEATSWQGVVVPAGTPRAIVGRLHVEIAKALHAPDVKERMTAEGSTPGGITPAAFAAFIKSETTKWANVVKLSGAKAE